MGIKVRTFFLLFFLFGILPWSAYVFSLYKNYEQEKIVYIHGQQEILRYYQKEILVRYTKIFSDIEYLSKKNDFINFLEKNKGRQNIEQDWLLFSETSGDYEQIRYLDETGQERIRINHNNGLPYVVATPDLQNKRNRYYFSMLLKEKEPQVIVSPVDLNIEYGEIEVPLKPIIRFSLPVFSRKGTFKGALILNYKARNLLENIEQAVLAKKGDLFVINSRGFFLRAPDPSYLWGFMYEGGEKNTLSDLYGLDMRESFSGFEGMVQTPKGLFVYTKIVVGGTTSMNAMFMEPWWVLLTLRKTELSPIINSETMLWAIIVKYWPQEIALLSLAFLGSLIGTILYSKLSTAERLRDVYKRVMVQMVVALELTSKLKDDDTGNHIKRVCLYSRLIAKEYGLSQEKVEMIASYASLHDIGKIGIEDSILKKPGDLTLEERRKMNEHVEIGGKLMDDLGFDSIACNIARYHHENWDKTGYGKGLSGEQIPLEARIVSLADTYDALRTKRCYKMPFPHERAREIIVQESGRKFDPKLVECFLRMEGEFQRVYETRKDEKDDVIIPA